MLNNNIHIYLLLFIIWVCTCACLTNKYLLMTHVFAWTVNESVTLDFYPCLCWQHWQRQWQLWSNPVTLWDKTIDNNLMIEKKFRWSLPYRLVLTNQNSKLNNSPKKIWLNECTLQIFVERNIHLKMKLHFDICNLSNFPAIFDSKFSFFSLLETNSG